MCLWSVEATNGLSEFIQPVGASCLALPNNQYAPSKCTEPGFRNPIAAHIPFQFFPPEASIGRWHVSQSTPLVLMPVTPMDLNYRLVPGEYEIGLAGQT